jgi:hypothetical protein
MQDSCLISSHYTYSPTYRSLPSAFALAKPRADISSGAVVGWLGSFRVATLGRRGARSTGDNGQ